MSPSSSRSRVSPTKTPKSPISTRIIKSIRHNSCPICLTRIETRKAAVIDTCMHAYCIDCIRKWSNLKRNCPLCNSRFNQLFFNISISTGNYNKLRLPNPKDEQNTKSQSQRGFQSNRAEFGGRRSIPQRSHASRSRQLPWRRSFGESRNRDEFRSRVLRWRASVYEQRLQAVPIRPHSRAFSHVRNGFEKERVEQRIRPWIDRELKAILGDLDPSVIVHLVASLWVSSIEEKNGDPSMGVGGKGEFVEKLRPFLHDYMDMFWHELRCFAESPFTMETYDSVVEYRRLGLAQGVEA
ncbi:hypothetical protein MRB53_010727 [Persea americana]|uniref:Uncharacterized protein n=1 Tax=Persea americana TaxID=3435 RepID=A0ACC2LSU8_PERAE|nr:hypothetical protein MRB53_010727 [Persea americana]